MKYGAWSLPSGMAVMATAGRQQDWPAEMRGNSPGKTVLKD